MSKKNIEKFSNIIKKCYGDSMNPVECDGNQTYKKCETNDGKEVDCPVICIDENGLETDCKNASIIIPCEDNYGNIIDCNEMLKNYETEFVNDRLFSKKYCHNDCNGIYDVFDNGTIKSCDTKNINNLVQFSNRYNSLTDTEVENFIKCNKDQENIKKKELTLYHENENLLNGYLKSSLQKYKSTVNERIENFNNKYTDKQIQRNNEIEENQLKYTDKPIQRDNEIDEYEYEYEDKDEENQLKYTNKPIQSYNEIEDKTTDDNQFKYINKTIQSIIDLEDKTIDTINATENEKLLEHITNIDDFNKNLKKSFRKYNNFVSIVLEVVSNYNKAILDKTNNITDETDASFAMRATYQSFKNNGTVYNILGSDNNILEFERQILEKTNVDLTEEVPVNGVTVDENGDVQEHQSRCNECSYLITALTKHQHLSLGQVNQLRKLMLKSFNNHSNRKFFSFYYENFEPIANMLVKENKLVEILPNMLKCVELVKNGLFDEAFEQYIFAARQAYMICKEMGMDTKELEEKWDRLDGYIDELPEPNNLFVEKAFEKAISVSN